MTVFHPLDISPFFTADAVACALLGGLLLGVSVAFKTSVTGQAAAPSSANRRASCVPSLADLHSLP